MEASMSHSFSFSALSRRSLLKKTLSALAMAALFPLAARPAMAAEGRNILIVYYSWSGNTRELAKLLQARLNADMVELQPVTPYPSGYNACVDLARKERDENIFPAIRPVDVDVARYSVILVGSPNWWGTWAGPVRTFLRDHATAGKMVLPFGTHGGGGRQNKPSDLAKLCPSARTGEGLFLRGGEASPSRVENWLKEAGLI